MRPAPRERAATATGGILGPRGSALRRARLGLGGALLLVGPELFIQVRDAGRFEPVARLDGIDGDLVIRVHRCLGAPPH
jgi:hypothetical protein